MAGTVTSLNVRLALHDAGFSRGLLKAEQEAGRFAKTTGKISSGLGNFSQLTSGLASVATAAGSSGSAMAAVAANADVMATTIGATTNVVFGMTAAWRALSASMLSNPIGIVIAGAAAAAATLLSIFRDTSKAVADTRTEVEKLEASSSPMERSFGAALRAGQERTKAAKEQNRQNEIAAEQRKKIRGEFDNARQQQLEIVDPVAARSRELILLRMTITESEQLLKIEAETARIKAEKEAAEEKAREAAAARESLLKSLADFERSAQQAWMTETEKKLAKLRELRATEAQLAAARENMEAAGEPAKRLEMLKKEIAEKKKLIGETSGPESLTATIKRLEESSGTKEAASPKALLKGSAEAALAEDRRKSPVDQLPDLLKKQLEEAKKQKALAEKQLAVMEKEQQRIAQF
jgi:hypothetical protein